MTLAARGEGEQVVGMSNPDSGEIPGLLLLKVACEAATPIYIVREWSRSTSGGEADEVDAYMFDERMCPSDVIGCEAVIEGDDLDPHGIFEFVQWVPRPADWPFTGAVSIERYRMLFSRMEGPTGDDR